jgi:hypothetical protein
MAEQRDFDQWKCSTGPGIAESELFFCMRPASTFTHASARRGLVRRPKVGGGVSSSSAVAVNSLLTSA